MIITVYEKSSSTPYYTPTKNIILIGRSLLLYSVSRSLLKVITLCRHAPFASVQPRFMRYTEYRACELWCSDTTERVRRPESGEGHIFESVA